MTRMPLPAVAVGIDIETTSLDPTSGDIIEVAAIRFEPATGRILDRFEALTAPRQPLSAEITALTGITNEMVSGQPAFSEMATPLQKFVGNDLLVAHNATFDLSWLAHHGCPLKNMVWDTFPLSSVAWPEASSYNLGTLAREQAVESTGEHRAAADIILTIGLLQKIRQQLAVSKETHAHIQHVLRASHQDHYIPLFSSQGEKAKSGSEKRETASSLDRNKITAVTDILGKNGLLSQHLPEFQFRPQQVALAEYIAAQLETKEITLVEAGAGLGKTYAYLSAALASNQRVLISTYTRVLQDQLVEKDVPRLLSALGLTRRVTALKGRRQYVCQRRLISQLKRKTISPPDAWGLIKVLCWLDQGGSGDLERLNFSHQHGRVLRSIHADHSTCRHICARKNPPDCAYQKARLAASQADLTVINHSLFLRWGTGEESANQAYGVVIADEAHHLEDAAISVSQLDLSPENLSEITSSITTLFTSEKITAECRALQHDFEQLLRQAYDFLEHHTTGQTIRLTRTTRRSSHYAGLEKQSEQVMSRFHFILGLIRAQEGTIKASQRKLYQDTARAAQQFTIELKQFFTPTAQRVQWIEREAKPGQARIQDATLNPGPYIQAALTPEATTVLISATLTVNNSFDYIQRRYQLENTSTKQFTGDFDYQERMRIIVVEDGPYPNHESYNQFSAQQICNIALVTSGRILALFTSQQSLEEVHRLSRNKLDKENISLFSQGISGGRANIAKRFRENHASILLGSGSFWEGFDSPGETLSVVVIPRLPFPQVGDPMIEALSEQAGDHASFREVMLPRMVLRLQQGVGRLLRTHSDRGVIVILDRRLAEKEYGREVLHSLPAAPIEIVGHSHVVSAVSQFFGEETLRRWQSGTSSKPS